MSVPNPKRAPDFSDHEDHGDHGDHPAPSLREAMAEREGEIQETLRNFYNKTGFEPATYQTPLSELLQSEEGMLDEWAVIRETAMRLMNYIGEDGPDPVAVLRRVYALGAHLRVSAFADLTTRDRAALTGDSHGAHHWIMKRIVTDPLLRNGIQGYKGPRQKGLYAQERAARAQKGNTNRKNGAKRRPSSKPKKQTNGDSYAQ